jgi:hypothetical protein
VSAKKAKKKGKGATKKSAKKSRKRNTPKTKKPADIVQVRENINNLVRDSAVAIATGVITVAKTGQLASAKYLFEAVGLYPATEQTAARPPDNSLAATLLKRMGLPLDPVVCDEDLVPALVTDDAKRAGTETSMPGSAENEGEARDGEQGPVLTEGKQ